MTYTEFLKAFDLKKLMECFCDPDKEYIGKKLNVRYDDTYEDSVEFFSNDSVIKKYSTAPFFSINDKGIMAVKTFTDLELSVMSLYKEDIYTDENETTIDYDKVIKTACSFSKEQFLEATLYALDVYKSINEI